MADKKKRGEAGKSNAENAPYRLNGGGCYPLYFRNILSCVPGVVSQIGRPPKLKAKE